MIDAGLYPHNNSLQREGVSYVIDNYFHLLKWHEDEEILDVGTGDGGIFKDLVLQKLPKNLKKLTLLDIDNNMLNLAKRTFRNNSAVNFFSMDICTKPTPPELVGNFDHIFSFYCLQFVKDHRQLMKILYDMLKPGGEILLTFVAKHAVFDAYRKLGRSDKWKPFLTDAWNMAPYQEIDDPVKVAKEFLKNAGFARYKCELIELQYTHQYSDFLKFLLSINPFIKNLPKQEVENYIQDHLKEVKEHNTVEIKYKNGKEYSVSVSYKNLVVFGLKPVI